MIAAFCNPTLALSLSALTARSLMLYDIRRLTYPGARNHGSSRDALASNITMNAVQRSHARRPISTNLAQSLCLARRKCDAYILLYSLSWIATRDFVMNSVLSFSRLTAGACTAEAIYHILRYCRRSNQESAIEYKNQVTTPQTPE